jgi:hypothetical protein
MIVKHSTNHWAGDISLPLNRGCAVQKKGVGPGIEENPSSCVWGEKFNGGGSCDYGKKGLGIAEPVLVWEVIVRVVTFIYTL